MNHYLIIIAVKLSVDYIKRKDKNGKSSSDGRWCSGTHHRTFAKKWLGAEHEVVVVTPNSQWNWIPSNIWVGVGQMKKKNVVFPLAPVYAKAGIEYYQAKAVSIHPEGKKDSDKPYITIEYTGQGKEGTN